MLKKGRKMGGENMPEKIFRIGGTSKQKTSFVLLIFFFIKVRAQLAQCYLYFALVFGLAGQI